MKLHRRELLKKSLFGGGLLGLRALATGLPASFLLERKARADGGAVCAADPSAAQYLILVTSGAGDPLNCNVPGTYDYPDIIHAADPTMAPTTFNLGSTPVKAAQIWSTLPQWVLDRTAFFHHPTYTNSHPNHTKVLRLMGSTANNEYLPSIFSAALAPCFSTLQPQPVSVGAGSILAYHGQAQPNLTPSALQDVLAQPQSPLSKLQQIRDQSLDEIHAVIKQRGSEVDRAFVDQMALSRQQARNISDALLSNLSGLKGDGPDSQITAAITLIRMNIAPVMAINVPFGGDNHTDPDLMNSEVPQHATGIQRLTQLMSELQAAGLQDKVTVMMMNVFGRTLKSQGLVGRTHWANHHATVVIGKNIKPGVYGGLVPTTDAKDYNAAPIDSRTGKASPSGDINVPSAFGAVAKTVGRALGVSQSVVDAQITTGTTITGALAF